MRKYKVNRTAVPNVPSKETIEKYKDFSRLTHAYDHYTKRPKKPLYKDRRMFLFILLIALAAYLIAESVESDNKEQQQKQEQQKQEQQQQQGQPQAGANG